jgi:hypothetical protein
MGNQGIGNSQDEGGQMSTVSNSLSPNKRIRGRAINSVAAFLRETLSVPEIYLEPGISPTLRPDVLAVDRAGSGDIHVVELKLTKFSSPDAAKLSFWEYARRFKNFPAHFKYLAVLSNPAIRRTASTSQALFADDGLGRIGVLFVDLNGHDSPTIEMLVKAERFRVPAAQLTKIEDYVGHTRPDIYVRV